VARDKAPHRFKVRPGLSNPCQPPTRHYFDVTIFPDADSMLRAGRRFVKRYKITLTADPFIAIVFEWWDETPLPDGSVRISDRIGKVLFHRSGLDLGTIAHESVHMADCFVRALDRERVRRHHDPGRELFAYSVESCVVQLATRAAHLTQETPK
jgi:hypothetical protein